MRKKFIITITLLMTLLFSTNVVSATTRYDMVDMFYPVGSIYETSDENFNPSETWGGNWDKLTDTNCVLVSASTDSEAKFAGGMTGGTIVEYLPSHRHIIPARSTTTGAQNANHQHANRYREIYKTGGSKSYFVGSGESTKKAISGISQNHAHAWSTLDDTSDTKTSSPLVPSVFAPAGVSVGLNTQPCLCVVRWIRTD